MWTLFKKELKCQIASPILAVSAALFLFLVGMVFTAHVTQVSPHNLPEASLRGMLYFMAVVLLFISPFLTMRTFAEERKTGTLEFLKTAPLTDAQMVLAKFFAAWSLIGVLVVLTAELPIFLMIGGTPDLGPMLLSYLGLLLLGGAFSAAGIFCSSLTKSQMIAAISTFILLLTLWFISDLGGDWGEKISVISPLESFSIGVLDLADTAYYLIFIFLFLFLTIRFLEAERWR